MLVSFLKFNPSHLCDTSQRDLVLSVGMPLSNGVLTPTHTAGPFLYRSDCLNSQPYTHHTESDRQQGQSIKLGLAPGPAPDSCDPLGRAGVTSDYKCRLRRLTVTDISVPSLSYL